MHLIGILDYVHVLPMATGKAERGDRTGGVAKQPLLEFRIGPCLGYDLGAIVGTDLVFVEFDQRIERSRMDQTLIDEQALQRRDPQGGVGRQLRRVVVIVLGLIRHRGLLEIAACCLTGTSATPGHTVSESTGDAHKAPRQPAQRPG